ncbi:MAG: hydantoinase B/oxoprolinase family protein [Legionella sp.]|uniref:hydantoinase B/oxoprolinase family protein n=1 Tax=Legionella sp. TaxID=459 RepID=UPI00284966BD|nr:hydantoinase B/oxoprolinase family protein [Legionella sp.]
MNKQPQWEFWIDRGGTFTDIVARTPQGQILSHKLLSDNPERYADAVFQGICDVLHCKVIPEQQIALIKMGTTVATNALLERRGEPVALAITKGFADALRIGYQNRPDLFALDIKLPSLLYDEVIEIKERIDAQGLILQPLDEQAAQIAMKKAYGKGYRAIAIVLMHAYHHSQHEKKLKAIARKIGFTQISVSHEVAPVMKLVGRGDTTVVDAYLSPVVQRYTQNLQQQLGKIPLFLMQSNGGLVSANLFQGKDSLFSGPAGGVVGMVKTSEMAGFNQAIGFDMGGTSTDVSHFAYEYERSYGCEFGGIRLRSPMMAIHTIAAGGGSILNFDGQRAMVGPNSAGANPGPTCYRRGGPLTITDCNVLLGKIQPQFFPKVFGPAANQEIDVQAVKKQFHYLANTMNQATGNRQSEEQIAESYLRIAVENMANAIKKISIQRGYDVRQYVLNCFGGAAGQHACLVADVLGMEKILIHPLAGVLSAYGMGLAEISVMHEQTVAKPLQRGIHTFLRALVLTLKKKAYAELHSQGIKDKKIKTKSQVHLRYQGADTTLVIDFAPIKQMRQNFIEQHSKKFGFASEEKLMIVETLSIECYVKNKNSTNTSPYTTQDRTHQLSAHETVQIFTHDAFYQAPIYKRKELITHDRIQGPAIITEDNATTIIEPSWQAEVTAQQNLLITRSKKRVVKQVATQADPAMLEVFNNRFMNIAEQMGEVLRNTASSVNIKERLDFSCAIFDGHGELVANAPHIPVHLGSMSESIKSLIQCTKGKMAPGDVYISNDPYHGGTHLPDITVITPIFDLQTEKLLFLVGSRAHHADIGGIAPGSIPAESKLIEEEGVLINQFKIMKQGYFLEKATLDLLGATNYPARNPQQNIEDLKAQIAANSWGVKGLRDLVGEFGLDVVYAYMNYVRDNATLAVEHLLTRLNEGSFAYSWDEASQIKVDIRINKKKKRMCIDFSGSSSQHPGNFNAPRAICKAAVLYVLRCLIAENIPLNNGCFVPIDLIIPEHSLLNPDYPAAVVAGNVETSQCIVDTLLGALGGVAASQGTCNNFTFGNNNYQYYETICGGAGAGPGFHGASAVHTHMTNTYLTDPEVLEWRFPILLEQFAIRRGSGGKGRYHGGDGIIRCIRFLEGMTANIISSHRRVAPYGVQGGLAGAVGHNWVQRAQGGREALSGCAQVDMLPGDVFIIETPGGGGYGAHSH